ncbi:inositol monophosphatase [Streptomyces cellostaticus]|uniref:Inositol monophosphatase n=1 Tax=Streptomyces cellostaticus TaxID=67285 RepID=A0A101NE45_9ACTN|nr:inositol monophosphatase [Streptomyces cellostaticus]KUM91396.1 inositol monophosphatase [Streptomyces cellostaticus]GHI04530.1 inositol monophosphatase [Streptomyces cellostaticus]
MSPNPDASPPQPGFAPEHRTAVAAAVEAGDLLRSRYPDGFAARPKGELGDVVTDLDVQAEQLVVGRIRSCFPRDRILAEESGELDGEGDGGRRTWLVDPLDGSNNVVIGLPVYVVGIALCVDDAPVVGVVHDPTTGRTWSARRGGGAHGPDGRLATPAHGRPLPPAGPLLAWTQGHAVRRDDPAACTLRHTLELRSRRLLQLWAPLVAWAMLARGDIDGFVGYRAEAIDLPAGALLAREAGMAVRHLDGAEFGGGFRGPDTGRSFVAGRPDVLPYLLDLVAASGSAPAQSPTSPPPS